MSGLARLTGIEKPMPVESRAIAVLMPTTTPDASRSGPPLLPGLIAASVWMRLRRLAAVGLDRAALRRDDAARDGVRERPERAADRDHELADPERVGVAEAGRGQAVCVDLDDRQVRQRVDAVDLAGILASRP